MGRASAVLAVIGILVLASACGNETESVSDDEIVRELGLEDAPTGDGYTVGDNLACMVTTLLNDSEEVGELAAAERRVALTSRDGRVGILVETPFAPACEREAMDGLNRLARRVEREDE
jgi:hypothetical protein